ncbi:polysaccharide lyase family 8 protein, partial [Mycena floridula]
MKQPVAPYALLLYSLLVSCKNADMHLLAVSSSGPTFSASSTLSFSSSFSSGTATAITSSAVQPTQTLDLDPSTAQDIELIHSRRLSIIVGELTGGSNIGTWLSTQTSAGNWPDVDYTTGCAARRANWPAQGHWQRLATMAGAWHGGLPGASQYLHEATVHKAISLGMDWWFARDLTNPACLASGGTASCPCSDTETQLWNTNWFSNIILIPELVSETCLLLNETLTSSQLGNCTHMTARSYGTFDQNIPGLGFLTGANTLDVAKIGIDLALLTVNVSLITDAYRRVHEEITIEPAVKADGIRPDGSFGQHGGILYNGNYGKDFTNDILDLEIEAGGTQFAANAVQQAAFSTLFDGDRWMIYQNTITKVLHWDFSVLGRFISFPVIDAQATGSININVTKVGILGQQWGASSLSEFFSTLSTPGPNANAGKLNGNRLFWDNDYMVHRGSDYVSTLKMTSNRTLNTECTNLQNPLGFHLSDGTLYTYNMAGDAYEDISVAWDWNRIPGITTDYGNTPLNCAQTQSAGRESFVGGVSNGNYGMGVMRYTNPITLAFYFQKAWFFLPDDIQHVMISNITSTNNATVISVFDQRRHTGDVLVDGIVSKENDTTSSHPGAGTLWHGGIGYKWATDQNVTMSTSVGPKTGNWSAIGTSTQPSAIVDLFAAWLTHDALNAISYTAFPSTTPQTFQDKSQSSGIQTLQNDAHVSAVFDLKHQIIMIVFWDQAGGSLGSSCNSTTCGAAQFSISANGNSAVIVDLETGSITVSDPSQSLASLTISLKVSGLQRSLNFTLPGGGLAGSSVTQSI